MFSRRSAAFLCNSCYRTLLGGIYCTSIECFCFNLIQKRPGLVETDVESAAETIAQIKGHLVEFPCEFLKNEELKKTRLIFKPSFFQ